MVDAINRMLAPLRNRVANMIGRAVVQLVTDSGGIQVLQLGVLEGETRDECERFQEYGFTSVPLPGAEAVVLFVGGRRDHPLVVAVDDRQHRLKGLKPGDSAVYSHAGARVVCRADGSIEVEAPGDVKVTGTSVVLNGGTQPVARVGDTAGPYPIVGGNKTVRA